MHFNKKNFSILKFYIEEQKRKAIILSSFMFIALITIFIWHKKLTL